MYTLLQSVAVETLWKLKKNFQSVFGFGVLLGLLLVLFSAFDLLKDNSKIQTQTQKGTFDYLPTSTTNQIIKHDYYTLSYNEKYEQAEWVAYELKKSYVRSSNFDRPYFIEDPKVKTGSADWRNYKKSGYDKGHLCPAGDMEFAINAYNDTFFTSNISPQKHDFNGGVWNQIRTKSTLLGYEI